MLSLLEIQLHYLFAAHAQQYIQKSKKIQQLLHHLRKKKAAINSQLAEGWHALRDHLKMKKHNHKTCDQLAPTQKKKFLSNQGILSDSPPPLN